MSPLQTDPVIDLNCVIGRNGCVITKDTCSKIYAHLCGLPKTWLIHLRVMDQVVPNLPAGSARARAFELHNHEWAGQGTGFCWVSVVSAGLHISFLQRSYAALLVLNLLLQYITMGLIGSNAKWNVDILSEIISVVADDRPER